MKNQFIIDYQCFIINYEIFHNKLLVVKQLFPPSHYNYRVRNFFYLNIIVILVFYLIAFFTYILYKLMMNYKI